MSVPTCEIFCSQCDFQSSSTLTWGKREYQLADGAFLQVRVSIGWCENCSNLVPVEDLSFKGLQGHIDYDQKQLCQLQEKIKKASSGIWATLGRTKGQIEWLKDQIKYSEESLKRFKLYESLFKSRESPSRCLICSKFPVIECDFPNPPEGGIKIVTDNIHPKCGGKFMIADIGLRVSINFWKVDIYSTEGVFIRKEDDQFA